MSAHIQGPWGGEPAPKHRAVSVPLAWGMCAGPQGVPGLGVRVRKMGVSWCISPQPRRGGLLSTAASRLCVSDHCSCWRKTTVGHPGGPSTLPQPPVLRCAPGDEPGILSGAGFQWQRQSARFPRPFSAAQQSPGAWRGGARSRGREGKGGEETELGAVNRFAFYGVREFISGHSPDGCNKLVKCDPPPGAGALARLREGRGVGIPGHSPDIPLIPHPLPPASPAPGKSRSWGPTFVSSRGAGDDQGWSLSWPVCGADGPSGDSFQRCGKMGLLASMLSLRGEHTGIWLLPAPGLGHGLCRTQLQPPFRWGKWEHLWVLRQRLGSAHCSDIFCLPYAGRHP